jgi:hypothetical protein
MDDEDAATAIRKASVTARHIFTPRYDLNEGDGT